MPDDAVWFHAGGRPPPCRAIHGILRLARNLKHVVTLLVREGRAGLPLRKFSFGAAVQWNMHKESLT